MSLPGVNMDLSELQLFVDQWIEEEGGGYWEDFQILARLIEELGEVSADLQRVHDLRPRESVVDIAMEVGDLLFTLLAFANKRGIDLAKAMVDVVEKYNKRDSAAWKKKKAGT